MSLYYRYLKFFDILENRKMDNENWWETDEGTWQTHGITFPHVLIWLDDLRKDLHNQITISWQELFSKFGSEYPNLENFKEIFLYQLSCVMRVHPDLTVDHSSSDSLTIRKK